MVYSPAGDAPLDYPHHPPPTSTSTQPVGISAGLVKWLDENCERIFVTAENVEGQGKWHINILFKTNKTYYSDYKWWERGEFATLGYKHPELQIDYFDDFATAPGYLTKESTHKVLYSKGFTDADISKAKKLYKINLERQAMDKFSTRFLKSIPADKLDGMVSLTMHIKQCNEYEAKEHMARMGYIWRGYDYHAIMGQNWDDRKA